MINEPYIWLQHRNYTELHCTAKIAAKSQYDSETLLRIFHNACSPGEGIYLQDFENLMNLFFGCVVMIYPRYCVRFNFISYFFIYTITENKTDASLIFYRAHKRNFKPVLSSTGYRTLYVDKSAYHRGVDDYCLYISSLVSHLLSQYMYIVVEFTEFLFLMISLCTSLDGLYKLVLFLIIFLSTAVCCKGVFNQLSQPL